MIEVRELTKRYGSKTAVDALSFTVRPGVVTGFLGPNGAGKSTTMRMILGLDRPTSGTALVHGKPYVQAAAPMREVGALLDASDVHGGRKARGHLKALALSNDLAASRADEVLELAGIQSAAGKRIGGFSLGMRQRLGIAAAMLGDPQVLLFDEPVNGLDPEGIQWIRGFMRRLAAEGRTVLVSSHLMSEMAQTAEHLVVIGQGKLLADKPTEEFVAGSAERHVRVRSPHPEQLIAALKERDADVRAVEDHLEVRGLSPADVGELAAARSVVLHELVEHQASLETAFFEMTNESVEYRTAQEAPAA